MVLLDVDFSEGDILTAGVVSSTSSVNGITTTVNSNTLTKLSFGGVISTLSSVVSGTAEMVLGALTIPGGTFATGAIINVMVGFDTNTNAHYGTFKLKTGVASSESIRQTIEIGKVDTGIDLFSPIIYYDISANYDNDVSILLTAQNSVSDANTRSTLQQLIVTGY